MYCFQVGSIKLPFMKEAMPMYCYLIEHPKGRVLVDTGAAYEYRDENTIMEESDSIICQLAKLGYTPDDIDYLIVSHLHSDHAGYLSSFPKATFVVRREEMRTAWWPEDGEFGYDFRTYKDTRNFKYIQLSDDEDYDLFMDGTVVLIDTRGHTRGHQSVIVDLPNTGKTVLAMDAAPDKDMLDRGFPGRPCSEGWQWVHSLRKLKHLADCGYKILFPHDMKNLPEKIFPEYFD
jgi:glyoxylase-like metal-dependent hydrolase (beta-lactamase superfamily II)